MDRKSRGWTQLDLFKSEAYVRGRIEEHNAITAAGFKARNRTQESRHLGCGAYI
jgi:hypothetical protein